MHYEFMRRVAKASRDHSNNRERANYALKLSSAADPCSLSVSCARQRSQLNAVR